MGNPYLADERYPAAVVKRTRGHSRRIVAVSMDGAAGGQELAAALNAQHGNGILTQVIGVLDSLPQRLHNARTDRDLTMAQVAEAAGVSSSTIWRIEDGKGARTDSLALVLRWLAKLEASR